MRYVDVAITDPNASSSWLAPSPGIWRHNPKPLPHPYVHASTASSTPYSPLKHVMEKFHRSLPNGRTRNRLHRLSNRLIKILTEIRKLRTA
jgi:hypothetical protein